jgi:hypothetical protein
MRGHGSTVAGSTLRQAVYRAIYAEWNAKLQLDALRLGSPIYLTREQAEGAARANDAAIDRAWHLWKRRYAKVDVTPAPVAASTVPLGNRPLLLDLVVEIVEELEIAFAQLDIATSPQRRHSGRDR